MKKAMTDFIQAHPELRFHEYGLFIYKLFVGGRPTFLGGQMG
jgi:hypothetical protein